MPDTTTSTPKTRIRTRLKRSRRKRKAQLRRLPGVLLPGAFLPHAFLPVSNSFSTTLRPVYLNGVPRGGTYNIPYPTNATSTLCGITPASWPRASSVRTASRPALP